MKDLVDLNTIVRKAEEYDTKNVCVSSDDDDSNSLCRRDSHESDASTSSAVSEASTVDKSDVDDLANALNSTLKVEEEEEPENQIDLIAEKVKKALIIAENAEKNEEEDTVTEKLKSSLKKATEDDLTERQPMRNHYSQRNYNYPYPEQNHINVSHFNGGSVSQSDYDINSNFEQLGPRSVSPPVLTVVPPSELPVLPGDEVSDYFNNLNPITDAFTNRQQTPPHSLSPSPSYASSELFSPPSNLSSADTESSQPVGSPDQNSFSDAATSGFSTGSSPSRPYDFPTTVLNFNSSDDEEQNGEATMELRNMIDTKYKEIKKYEWIAANTKEVQVLISELRKLICKESRLNDRKLVKIYAAISAILKQEKGPLVRFFLAEKSVLSSIAAKNHPLLFKYIVETIQGVGLNPESISESLDLVLKRVVEQNEDMTEMLKTVLSLKTKNNVQMFDLNEVGEDGLTIIHRILFQIGQNPVMKSLAMGYFKICLDHKFDLTTKSLLDGRTYLHHAVAWGCDPQVIDLMLRHWAVSGPTYNLVKEEDINGDSAQQLADGLIEGRDEIQLMLRRYAPEYDVYSDDFLNCQYFPI